MYNSQEQLNNAVKSKYGIYLDTNRHIWAKDKADFKNKVTQYMTVNDADTFAYNPSSNGVLPWQLMVNSNVIVDKLLKARVYTKVGSPFQQGTFETNFIQYTTRAPNGGVEAYDDFSASQVSDVNVTYPMVDALRLQTITNWGDLEVATMSTAKIDAIASKEYSAMENIAIAQNKLFWFGNINSSGGFITRTFGMLNSPMLNPDVPVGNGSGSSPLWSDKIARGATQDIINDITVTALNALQAQMGGNLDDIKNIPMILIVGSSQIGTLEGYNQFGLVPSVALKGVLPKLEIIYASEYDLAGVFQLCVDEINGQKILQDAFTYKYKGHGIVKQLSSYRQKNSFGSAGFVCLNYAGIITMSGAY